MKSFFYILVFVNFIFADVIYFTNGDIDEGIVQTNDVNIIIQTKDRMGSYSVPKTSVVSIDYGKWIKDLDGVKQEIALKSKKTTKIKAANTKEVINKVKYSLPKNVFDNIDHTEEKVKKQSTFLLIFILVIFVLLCGGSLVCNIIVLIDAFKRSILWGLFSLFIPIVLLIYLITNYSGNKSRMFFWMFAPIFWLFLSYLIIMSTS